MTTHSSSQRLLASAQYHSSWHEALVLALDAMHPQDLEHLVINNQWLPGRENCLNAFSIPMGKVKYLLLGESPYPRAESANGYAFWDGAVSTIWSPNGLSKPLNRATSLRNFIKMLLVAQGDLSTDQLKPMEIAKLDKTKWIQTLPELFQRLLSHGFLLLNASLSLESGSMQRQVKQWQPFIERILAILAQNRPDTMLVMMGNFAKQYAELPCCQTFPLICLEHPYNLSFITNPSAHDLFGSLQLLY